MDKGTFPLRDREIRGQELKWKRCTSNNHKYCLTASAVPWNQSSPFSPGVWVAAKTYIKWYSGQITSHLPAQQVTNPLKRGRRVQHIIMSSLKGLLHFCFILSLEINQFRTKQGRPCHQLFPFGYLVSTEFLRGVWLEVLWNKPYLNKPITKIHTISKIVSSCKMPVERCGVKLGENEHFVDATIDAVAHWHINQPVGTSNGHLQSPHSRKLPQNPFDSLQIVSTNSTYAATCDNLPTQMLHLAPQPNHCVQVLSKTGAFSSMGRILLHMLVHSDPLHIWTFNLRAWTFY